MEEGVEGRGVDGRDDGEGERELGEGRGESLGPALKGDALCLNYNIIFWYNWRKSVCRR